jgi:glucosyl-3-phosphoglycerate synthase
MVSVIIPVLNEGATIRKVIRLIRQSSIPLEIIVVDDNSTDNTIAEIRKESVRIITSSKRGKGLSMREGLLAAKHEVIVYLDGDITTYPPDVVDLLANPILKNEADFVKSTFKRQAGRVTQLVAKPLLSILFPELTYLDQPLSGMIAGKKSFLQGVSFEKDYGVDIGLLIDMHRMGARIKQVNIGSVKNAMQSLEQLGKMSKEVSRTILNKADAQSLQTLGHIDLINRQMESAVLESIDKMKKMVLLEMDQVVLDGNFGETAAKQLGLSEGFEAINEIYLDPAERLKATASLFAGTTLPDLLEIADGIPLVPGIHELITELKKRGYNCGLITEQFSCVANHLKNTLGFDFVLSNHMKLDNGIVTGEIELAPYFVPADEPGRFVKHQVFSYIQERYNQEISNVIYVTGNSHDKACIDAAGIGHLVRSSDLVSLLDILPGEKPGKNFLSFVKPSRPAHFVIPAVMVTAIGVIAYLSWKAVSNKVLDDLTDSNGTLAVI